MQCIDAAKQAGWYDETIEDFIRDSQWDKVDKTYGILQYMIANNIVYSKYDDLDTLYKVYDEVNNSGKTGKAAAFGKALKKKKFKKDAGKAAVTSAAVVTAPVWIPLAILGAPFDIMINGFEH